MPTENKTIEKLQTIEKMINELVEVRHQIIELKTSETQRQMAMEALQSSENKYRTLVENIPQKLFIKDKNSVYVSCNEKYAQDLKIKVEEIPGKTDYDFFPQETAEKYIADDQRIMETGKPADIEDKYLLDGKEAIVHMVKTPVKDEKGNIVGILGTFWDISEQKKKEDELEKELSLLKDKIGERLADLQTLRVRIQNESQDRERLAEELRRKEDEYKDFRIVLEKQILERTTELQTANDRIQKELGERKQLEEELRRVEDDFKKTRSSLEGQLLERTRELKTINEELQRETAKLKEVDEKRHKAEEKVSALEQRLNGQFADLQVLNEKMQRETSDHQRAKEALRRMEEEVIRLTQENTITAGAIEALKIAEQKYRGGLESAPVGIWVLRENKIIFANPKCTEIFGYSPEELTAKSLTEIFFPDHQKLVLEKYNRWLKGEVPAAPYVCRFRLKDGGYKWLKNNPARLEWEGKPAIINLVIDVTKQRQAEEALRHSVEPFHKLVQAMEGIVSTLEQELK